jgi:hypothetical protein
MAKVNFSSNFLQKSTLAKYEQEVAMKKLTPFLRYLVFKASTQIRELSEINFHPNLASKEKFMVSISFGNRLLFQFVFSVMDTV